MNLGDVWFAVASPTRFLGSAPKREKPVMPRAGVFLKHSKETTHTITPTGMGTTDRGTNRTFNPDKAPQCGHMSVRCSKSLSKI